MKPTKNSSGKLNPYDLGSVAKHTNTNNKVNISSLRSLDINSAGGRNSTVVRNSFRISKGK